MLQGKLLIIEYRSFGDAVIQTGLINTIGENFPQVRISILTKPQYAAVFKHNPNIAKVYCSDFPFGPTQKRTIRGFIQLMKNLYEIRQAKFDYCINTVGDFRENLLGYFTGATTRYSVIRSKYNPFRQMLRQGLSFLNSVNISIPDDVINIYDVQKFVSIYLGCLRSKEPKIFIVKEMDTEIRHENMMIGIHPMASQVCKIWPWDKWIQLIRILQKQNRIVIFCSPNENKSMMEHFGHIVDNEKVMLRSDDLEEFFVALSKISILIGLDSFSVHASYALNIKCIMLNGGNDIRSWCPPNTTPLSRGDLCSAHPCFNRPKCSGEPMEYTCIRSIEVEDVLIALNDVMSGGADY